MKRGIAALIAISAGVVCPCLGGTYEANWKSLNAHPCPQWWQDAKFGIFIHWGVYSVPAYADPDAKTPWWRYAEQYWTLMGKSPAVKAYHERHFPGKSYQDLAPLFTAKDFDPERWADLFRRAGAKYVVLTARHHDGFALWPSKLAPGWNAGEVGPKRDLCGDIAKAVKNAGLRMGFYFSHLQWHHPLYGSDPVRFAAEVNVPQMKELVMSYRPDLVWGDGEWDHPWQVWYGPEFLAWLYNESPVKDVVAVNDRWGKGMRSKCGDYYSTEYSEVHGISSEGFVRPFEECRGIGFSFGYNRFETTKDYHSNAECIEELVEKVSRGGNLLLNVGPDSDGIIPTIMEERLLAIGKWLEVNGEAIYGTRAWISRPKTMRKDRIYFTQKNNVIYVICFRMPDELSLAGVGDVASVSLLGCDRKVKWRRDAEGLVVEAPRFAIGEAPCECALTLKITQK